jgi:hypothetical protein
MTMLTKIKPMILAAMVATTASLALAAPSYARHAANSDNGAYANLDVRSAQSKELDPIGGSFQGP